MEHTTDTKDWFMTSSDEKLVKGEELHANVQRLEAERDALMREALDTKTTPPELSAKTAQHMEAYKEDQEHGQEDVSPYSDY